MSWDPSLAEKANLPLAELRAYESIFHKLDPQSEGEINVTKCDAPVCFILLQRFIRFFFEPLLTTRCTAGLYAVASAGRRRASH